MEILTPGLELVEDTRAEPAAIAIEEAKFQMLYPSVKQTIPDLLTKATTAKITI